MECVNEDLNLCSNLLNIETHRDHLIKCIGQKYFDLRNFHEIRKTNDTRKIRQKLTKNYSF